MAAPIHVTTWDDGGGEATAVLVHGTMTWGTDEYGFAAQRPLADRFRLLVCDRRGFGASPHTARSDYAVDAADVCELLGAGVHLVGHSYGAVVAMLAAARSPGRVRSLALIEPAAHRAAADDPAVAAAREWMRAAGTDAPAVSPREWLRRSTEAVGMPPLAWLRAAPYPKLVIAGTWEVAPAAYRKAAGAAGMACARLVAERIGARLLQVAGSSHWPQRERSDAVNAALLDLWTTPPRRPGTDPRS